MATPSISMTLIIALISIWGCTPENKAYRSPQTSGSTEQVTNPPILVDEDDDTADRDADATKSEKPANKKPAPASADPAEKPKNPTNFCGSLAIVGGTVATMNDMVVKSTVRITLPNEFCTGTIIGPNQIVTAAHCFKGDAGTSAPPAPATINIEFGVQPKADATVKVKGFAVHPDYKGLGLDKGQYLQNRLYDVAVITFDGKIPAGYAIAPVGSTANLKTGSEITLAGYGAYSDNDRTERPLTIVKTALATVDANFKELQLQVGGGKGGCYGDSGGPSYVLSESGLCLNTLSTTTGPGRANKSGLCTEGSATLMDITAYQGWMSCSYEKLSAPLSYLLKDESKDACVRTTVNQ